MVKILLKIFFVSVFVATGFAQTNKQIDLKTSELSKINQEIAKLENQLKNLTTKEKESLGTLNKIEEQKLLLGKAISGLIKLGKQKEKKIQSYNAEIKNFEKKINDFWKKKSNIIDCSGVMFLTKCHINIDEPKMSDTNFIKTLRKLKNGNYSNYVRYKLKYIKTGDYQYKIE